MSAGRFISSRLRFRGKLAICAIAVSFAVIIIALAVSSGYRESIHDGVSKISGDIQLSRPDMNLISPDIPVHSEPACLPAIASLPGVKEIMPVVYRGGIVKKDGDIRGVVFKGVPGTDSTALQVSVPSGLAASLGLQVGEEMLSYFVGERLQARKFKVASIYESLTTSADNQIVIASLGDMQRVNNWSAGEASALEILLEEEYRSKEKERELAFLIGGMACGSAGTDERNPSMAVAAVDRYAQLFDWLTLIDFNVKVILALMILVAGFNMISGLLIMLFRNISTIGTLKSLGMGDRGVGEVFLRVAARTVAAGMLIGNAAAVAFCLVQRATRFLKLDPANYFVSYVPVRLDLPDVLAVDAIAFTAIMLLLLIPTLFISRVDPAETMRVK